MAILLLPMLLMLACSSPEIATHSTVINMPPENPVPLPEQKDLPSETEFPVSAPVVKNTVENEEMIDSMNAILKKENQGRCWGLELPPKKMTGIYDKTFQSE